MTGKLLFEALQAAALEPAPYMRKASRVDDRNQPIPGTEYTVVTLDTVVDLEEAARLLTEWIALGDR